MINFLSRLIYHTFLHRLLSDELHIKILFRGYVGYWPNLKSPKTFNEKLQWLKLHDRKPKYTTMADKFAVREYIAKTIGEQYLIPLLGVWDKFNDIDFEKLPDQFVLKCTHNSGGNIICKDKNNFNISKARKKMNWWLSHNYFYANREWPYKNIKPRIIAEKYMVDESGDELKDYKVFCFNGEPKIIQVDYDRFTNHKRNIYNTAWNYVPVVIKFPTDPNKVINKPSSLEEMLGLAKLLSKGFSHIRVDFYSVYDSIYFREFTFTHGSGFEVFEPKEFDLKMGSWIELPKEKT